jgi:hypothetical protein
MEDLIPMTTNANSQKKVKLWPGVYSLPRKKSERRDRKSSQGNDATSSDK